MGTPALAVPVLSAILRVEHNVVGVFTQPDRQRGRGRRLSAPAVKELAQEKGIRIFQPPSLRKDEKARKEIASLRPDIVVVAAYGLFLPSDVLGLPPLGCLNVHPSLLPRYRGPSPVASAILNGDPTTGVTIMQVDEGMDAGPIVAQQATPIGPDETTGELTARLFTMGAELLVQELPRWQRGETKAQPQNDSLATVTTRLTKEDGEIDWSRPADYIARQVRAYQPWPGSFTHWSGKTLKIEEASAGHQDVQPSLPPGLVILVPNGVAVTCGDGVLELKSIQLEGRRASAARDFVQGYQTFPGSRLGA